jgi:hypothetical protein
LRFAPEEAGSSAYDILYWTELIEVTVPEMGTEQAQPDWTL